MEAIVTIGLDIAKSVFQVHGVDADGAVVVRRSADAREGAVVLREASALPRRPGGLRHGSLLGSRTSGSLATMCG